MATPLLAPPTEIIHLSGISWLTYERLRMELSDRRLRLTYCQGHLEIMSPSPEHELSKEVLGRFVETLAEELQVQIYPLGSTTLSRPETSGVEPDKCFYIHHIEAVQGKRRLTMATDPPPDLILEIDVTSSSSRRLQTYADMGVPEVWVYDGSRLIMYQLQGQAYQPGECSQFFPSVAPLAIAQFLQQATTEDYLSLVRTFRAWVRQHVQSGIHSPPDRSGTGEQP